jgi:hypothetical protein
MQGVREFVGISPVSHISGIVNRLLEISLRSALQEETMTPRGLGAHAGCREL